MSMGPVSGVAGSAAGAPLSQTAGSETERAAKDAKVAERKTDTDQKADQAAGIGQTDKDEGTSERDADGRQFWETPAEPGTESAEETNEPQRQVKDPTGESGSALDLTG